MNPPPVSDASTEREAHSPHDLPEVRLPQMPQSNAPPLSTSTLQSLRRADGLLASCVVLLAFFLASTPARNSDLWLHFATGRALVEGNYRFQGDPFAQDANVWIVHSWLSDLVLYELFTTLGGGVLVVAKALLVALVAALLINLGARAGGLFSSALAVVLALLALSDRVLLQPALLSLLLLAVTLTLLERGRCLRRNRGVSWLRAYGAICFVFALWANCDEWFLLGPVTVALYLLGEGIAAVFGGAKNGTDLPGLSLTLLGGLLACLLTPFHIHGLTLPSLLGLTPTTDALKHDPVLQQLFVSPFDASYFDGAVWSVSRMTYLVLLVLSGLSFLGSREGWRSWRFPVWLGFFGLSAWSARAIPYFAVAAAPILALNVQDLVAAYRPQWLRSEEGRSDRLARAAALLLLLALLLVAWPGWLQTPPYEMRRWAVLEDPSLRLAAQEVAAWRAEGKLSPEEHGFNFAPEAASYFAWFCPAEKSLVDVRLQAPPSTAADYVALRRHLLNDAATNTDWRRILRSHRINHVILYDTNFERVQAVYRRLIQHGDEWFMLALKGRTAIFGWRDPHKAVRSPESLRLHLREQAYAPRADEQAPADWPGRGPEIPSWWHAFVKTRPANTVDREEAALLLSQFDALRTATLVSHRREWDACCIAGAIAQGGANLSNRLQQTIHLFCSQVLHGKLSLDPQGRLNGLDQLALTLSASYFQTNDDAPPEYLWLAIRAARRAVHHDPDDAYAYLILGEAYLRLRNNTRERIWCNQFSILNRIREVQTAAGLHQALLLQPDLLAAHAALVALYQQGGHRDLQLHHLREVFRLTQEKGRLPGETLNAWEERLSHIEKDIQRLEEHLRRLQDDYELDTVDRKTMERVEAATNRGLTGKALEMLLESDAASFGARGVRLELHLLLTTGRVQEVRAWMTEEHRELLGEEMYSLLRMELAAACGDYASADAELAALSGIYGQVLGLNGLPMPARQALCLGVSQMVFDGRMQQQSSVQLAMASFARSRFFQTITNLAGNLQKEADTEVLLGLFAWERGDTRKAASFFDRAFKTYQSREADASGAGLDFSGRPLVETYRSQLAAHAR